MTLLPTGPAGAATGQLAFADATTSAALAALEDEGRRLDAKSRADRTWLGYQRDWHHFTDWCQRFSVASLPATPETVAAYLTDAAKTFKTSTLRRRLAAISVVHKGYGCDSPTASVIVRTRMSGIARDKADVAVTRKAPAWGKEVRRMVSNLDDEDARDIQTRCLLTLGFAGGFRRSELVALNVTDVTESDDGLVVRLRRSKTDQEGIGRSIGIPYGPHPSSCPVRAYRAWRQLNDVECGALFRTVRGRKPGGKRSLGDRLSDKAVARLVKDRALSLGLDPDSFAGHSLRAGFVTSAAHGGASEAAIMAQTGHRSSDQVRTYMRNGNLFHNNAAAVTGL
jgi:site-specific recombinase XerD